MAESLRLVIIVDDKGTPVVKKFDDSIKKVSPSTDKLSSSFKKVGTSIGAFATSALGLTAGIAGLGLAVTKAVGIIGGFDQSMANVQAVTRASSSEMQAMTDVARRLGATTEFSASQAASGMEFLGRAGFSTTNIIKAMPAALDLATAGALGLGEAADIASNIMAGFSIQAEDLGKAGDVIAATAASANTNVQQLGEAMKYVGPVASALGISMSDSAAAIGVLSNAGIQASVAGTGLRRILSELASPSSAAKDAIATLGLTLQDLNPTANSLIDIVTKLGKANLTAAQAFEIFGDRGAPAILALTSQTQDLVRLTETTNNSEGRLKEMADTMRNTIPGAGKAFLSAIQENILALGDAGLTNVIRNVIDAATGMARGLGTVIKIGGDLVGIVGSVASKVTGASGSFGSLAKTTGLSADETKKLKDAYAALGLEIPNTIAQIELAKASLEKYTENTKKSAFELAKQMTGLEFLRDALKFAGDRLEEFRQYMGSSSVETNRLLSSIDATANRIEEMGQSAPMYLEGVSEYIADVGTSASIAGATVTTKLQAAFETLGINAPAQMQKVAESSLQAFETIISSGQFRTEQLIQIFFDVSDKAMEAFGTIPPEFQKSMQQMARTAEVFGATISDELKKALGLDGKVKDVAETVIGTFNGVAAEVRKGYIPSLEESQASLAELQKKNEEWLASLEKTKPKLLETGDAMKKGLVEPAQAYKDALAQSLQSDALSRHLGVWDSFTTKFPTDLEGVVKEIGKYDAAIQGLNRHFSQMINLDAPGYTRWQANEYSKAIDILNDRLFKLELQTWDTNRATKELAATFGFTTEEAKGLAQAYEILGIKSSTELTQIAERSVIAFDQISQAGTESSERLSEIWLNQVLPQLEDAFGTKIPSALENTTDKFKSQAQELEVIQKQWESVGSVIVSTKNKILSSNPGSLAMLTPANGLVPFQSGGMVGGIGSRDSIPAMLSPGEFVVSAPAVKSVGVPTLERMNHQGSQNGGLVGGTTTNANVTVNLTLNLAGIDPKNLDAKRITRELGPSISEAIRTGEIKVS